MWFESQMYKKRRNIRVVPKFVPEFGLYYEYYRYEYW